MAEMPSVGRILRVSIAGVVAAASLGISASSASAGDVWLWACHGPERRRPLTADRRSSEISTAPVLGGGCGAADAARLAGRLPLKLASRTPADGSKSSLVVTLPAGPRARRPSRSTARCAASRAPPASRYRLAANNADARDRAPHPTTGALPIATPAATSVTLDLSCSSSLRRRTPRSTSSASRSSSPTTRAPSGGVSWNTPVDHTMEVTPTFTDVGAGLDRAELTIGGRTTAPVYFTTDSAASSRPPTRRTTVALDAAACRNGDDRRREQAAEGARGARSSRGRTSPVLDADGKHAGKWVVRPAAPARGSVPVDGHRLRRRRQRDAALEQHRRGLASGRSRSPPAR